MPAIRADRSDLQLLQQCAARWRQQQEDDCQNTPAVTHIARWMTFPPRLPLKFWLSSPEDAHRHPRL